jgi:hypothetical protein
LAQMEFWICFVCLFFFWHGNLLTHDLPVGLDIWSGGLAPGCATFSFGEER